MNFRTRAQRVICTVGSNVGYIGYQVWEKGGEIGSQGRIIAFQFKCALRQGTFPF